MTHISIPLMLPNIEVININYIDNNGIIVRVSSTESGVDCKVCGKHITKYHGLNKTIILKHLSAFGNNCYIEFQPIRFQCLTCDNHPTTTQKPSWYQTIGQCTTPYAQYILESLINSTIQDVAIKENISYDQVMSIIKKHVPEEIDWSTIKSIKDIGIDEISLKKGHKDFVVIISSKKNGKPIILGILKDRKKSTVKDFLLSIPKHLADTVKNVCCDMYDGFINAAKEAFGSKVNVIIDRFHVAQNYRKAIDTLRKKEMKRLKLELSEEDYKKLKNIMWILRKNYNELTDNEKDILQLLFKFSPLLKKAYTLQNELTNIFNKPLSKRQANRKISQWIKKVENSNLTCFNTFIKTLKKLWNEILNYFINRLNSGFVEGLNNKIKILKRRCYGIFDLKNLFRRIVIDLGQIA